MILIQLKRRYPVESKKENKVIQLKEGIFCTWQVVSFWSTLPQGVVNLLISEGSRGNSLTTGL